VSDRGTHLYVLEPDFVREARGLFWPEPDKDPDRSELVALEADLRDWLGDDVLGAFPPWHLMSERLLALVRESGLTGPRIGAEAGLGPADAGIGGTGGRRFRIVVPEAIASIRVRGKDAADGISVDDRVVYADWRGSDFSRLRDWPGMLVTERAMSVLRTTSIVRCHVREVMPDVPPAT
jgi:hypothetical protein